MSTTLPPTGIEGDKQEGQSSGKIQNAAVRATSPLLSSLRPTRREPQLPCANRATNIHRRSSGINLPFLSLFSVFHLLNELSSLHCRRVVIAKMLRTRVKNTITHCASVLLGFLALDGQSLVAPRAVNQPTRSSLPGILMIQAPSHRVSPSLSIQPPSTSSRYTWLWRALAPGGQEQNY